MCLWKVIVTGILQGCQRVLACPAEVVYTWNGSTLYTFGAKHSVVPYTLPSVLQGTGLHWGILGTSSKQKKTLDWENIRSMTTTFIIPVRLGKHYITLNYDGGETNFVMSYELCIFSKNVAYVICLICQMSHSSNVSSVKCLIC